MKQKLLLKTMLLLCALIVGGVGPAWADVTVTFASSSDVGTGTSASGNNSVSKSGITISCTGGGFAISGGAHYRLGSGSTTTISSTVGNIKSIVVNGPTGTDSYSISKFGSNTGWTLDSSKGTYTWNGNSASVSVKANSGQVRPTSIVVTYTPSAVPITSISGMASSVSIEVGGTTTLTPTILPANTTETVVWESSDDGVATVSAGVVTGVASGSATITAKSPSDATIKAECTVTVNAATTVATPTLSVAAGTYNVAQSVELACLTDGATIRYTTNGDDPTESSTVYSSAITVGRTMTIKAKAFKGGLTASSIASATYTLQCVAPTFSPAAASTQVYGTEITISSTTGATIYYTTNGDTPDTSSSVYNDQSKPTITATQTFKAIAAMDGWSNSEVSSAAYTLKLPNDPTFSLEAGMVSKGATLTLTSEGATIRYTTDGTEPSASVGTVYSTPITINSAQTIKAVAYDAGGNESDVVTKAYTVFVGDIVTFDATSDTDVSDGKITKNGVSFTLDAVNTTDNDYRIYKNNTSTFTTSNGKFVKIEFNCSGSNPASGFSSQTGWTTSGNNGTWIGSASSVSFTASSKQVRAQTIVAYVAKTAAPTFSVFEDTYSSAQSVTISCATDDADIYYTLDGSTPSSSSTEYTGAIAITETTTLKAIAIYDGVESNVTSATYTMNRPLAPTFDVAAGVFGAAFTLHLATETNDAAIYYTNDGTTPSNTSTLYSEGVSIPAGDDITIKAVAVKDGLTSDVASATYTYDTRPAPTFTLSTTSVNLKVNETSSAVSLTTNSDGAITFSCADAHVTLTGTGSSRTISADAAGEYTINVSTAATSNYLAGAGTITVTVTKKVTTMVLTPSFSSKDLYVTTTGSLTGVPQYNSLAVAGAAVTYTSSDTKVATIASDGTVTFKKDGSTTLTVSYAGNDEYEECEATYVLELIDTTPQETSVSITLNNTFFGCDAFNSYAKDSPTSYSGTKDKVEVTYSKGTGSGFYCNASGLRIYSGGSVTFTAPTNYYITSIVLSGEDGFEEGLTNPEASTTWEGSSATVEITGETKKGSTRKNMTDATVTLAPIVTLPAAIYATRSYRHALDFSGTGIKAYTVKVNAEKSTARVTEIASGKVPANEGVILYAEEAGDYAVPVAASASALDNDLIGVTEATTVLWQTGDKYNYILQRSGSDYAFNKANEDGATLAANRAYLQTTYDATAEGARLVLVFDDETTGISDASRLMDNGKMRNDNFFNLKGQRVENPLKGQLYIVNGKKVVIK